MSARAETVPTAVSMVTSSHRAGRWNEAGGDRSRDGAHRVAAGHRCEAALLEDDDPEVGPGRDRRQYQDGAEGWVPAGLMQEELAQPVQVLPAVGQAFGHGVAADEVPGVEDDATGLALGVDLDRGEREGFDSGHRAGSPAAARMRAKRSRSWAGRGWTGGRAGPAG